MGEHLIIGDFADDEALTDFYHTRLMVPRLDPNLLARIPRRIIQKIPVDMAAEFRVIPVALDRDQNLTLAMSDPSDTHAVDEIGFFTGCYVMRAVATQRQLAWCLAHYYGHVTMLGETLLEPSPEDAEPTPAAAPEPALSPADGVPKPMRGPGHITQQVEASRHRVQPPVASNEDDDESDDDDDAGLVVYDEDDDDGAGAADDTVEVVIEAEPPTGPTGPTHQKYQAPNPPELSPRVGEVVVRTETDATPASSNPGLPAVVIAAEDPEETIVALNDDDEDEDDDDHVVILDRPARSSSPPPVELVESGPPAAEDSVVILDTPKKRRRAAKQTRMGLGIIEAAPRARTSSAPPMAEEPEATSPVARSRAVPEPIALGEANATGRHARVDYDETGWDDGFGPPGTTIPPPYLGAMPDTEATGPHNAIPINVPDDESGAVSTPISLATATPSARIVALANTLTDAADSQRELDESAIRLVETLRALDGATTRDAVVEALLDHMARSFGRATFFVVKGNDLVPFRSKGVASMAPGWKNARLSLDAPSTIRDVVQARLPFRGPISDDLTRGLMMSVMGRVPDEVLLLPCTVRERPVGVLCGAERSRRIFHEHLAVISRGAGAAFERILKARKA